MDSITWRHGQQRAMTTDNFIAMLDGVRRSNNGCVALCPAHDDRRHPNLQVRKGDNGVLVKCWAGCSIHEICESLGIRVRDLFYDSDRPLDFAMIQQRERGREVQQRRDKAILLADVRSIDVFRNAARTLHAFTGIEIGQWTASQQDYAMDMACDAHAALCEEQRTA